MTKQSNAPLGWQSFSLIKPSLFSPYGYDSPPRSYLPLQFTKKPLSPINYTYWCSWYALSYHPTAQEILHEAKSIKRNQLSIDYILIDDGWQEKWLTPLSQELRGLGFKVGLWYAPFGRHNSLPLYHTLNRLINSYNLEMLKLDFLYKVYYDKRIVNPQFTLISLFDHLTANYPSLLTIGCGAPFAESINRLSAIRLSRDNALPYPAPAFINRVFYLSRLKLLFDKYQLWQNSKHFSPDPDVRMFNLDTPKTDSIWSKMPLFIRGIGDKVSQLNEEQIKKARIWLKS